MHKLRYAHEGVPGQDSGDQINVVFEGKLVLAQVPARLGVTTASPMRRLKNLVRVPKSEKHDLLKEVGFQDPQVDVVDILKNKDIMLVEQHLDLWGVMLRWTFGCLESGLHLRNGTLKLSCS